MWVGGTGGGLTTWSSVQLRVGAFLGGDRKGVGGGGGVGVVEGGDNQLA